MINVKVQNILDVFKYLIDTKVLLDVKVERLPYTDGYRLVFKRPIFNGQILAWCMEFTHEQLIITPIEEIIDKCFKTIPPLKDFRLEQRIDEVLNEA